MSQTRKLWIGVNKKSIGTEQAAGSRVTTEPPGKVVVERTSPPLNKSLRIIPFFIHLLSEILSAKSNTTGLKNDWNPNRSTIVRFVAPITIQHGNGVV